MAENLKTTKYQNGSAIPTGYDAFEWDNLINGLNHFVGHQMPQPGPRHVGPGRGFEYASHELRMFWIELNNGATWIGGINNPGEAPEYWFKAWSTSLKEENDDETPT